MDKQTALEEISQQIERCKICKVGKIGRAVPGEGNPNAKIVFIGEAPGKTEAKTGRPFVGRSGQLLRKLIRSLGLDDLKDVYITSPVKYLPKKGTPSAPDIIHGRKHLVKQLAVIDPKIIVLLGRVAAQGVLQHKVLVKTDHGKIINKDGKKYLLTLHPAAALRFPPLKLIIEDDFRKLKSLAS